MNERWSTSAGWRGAGVEKSHDQLPIRLENGKLEEITVYVGSFASCNCIEGLLKFNRKSLLVMRWNSCQMLSRYRQREKVKESRGRMTDRHQIIILYESGMTRGRDRLVRVFLCWSSQVIYNAPAAFTQHTTFKVKLKNTQLAGWEIKQIKATALL